VFPNDAVTNIISTGSTTSPVTAVIPSSTAAGSRYSVQGGQSDSDLLHVIRQWFCCHRWTISRYQPFCLMECLLPSLYARDRVIHLTVILSLMEVLLPLSLVCEWC
jgi:hypothetical protein